jgi:hypothetical protein
VEAKKVTLSTSTDYSRPSNTLRLGTIWMCETYQAPRPRVNIIASFAGPRFYRELALVDRSSLSLLKKGKILRLSLGIAGWTDEVLKWLGRDWFGKVTALEKLWRMEPMFAVLYAGVQGSVLTFLVGPTVYNPDLVSIVSGREWSSTPRETYVILIESKNVKDSISLEIEGIRYFPIENCELATQWYFRLTFTSECSMLLEFQVMLCLMKTVATRMGV